jgi:adenosylcobinamide-phosphate synthase
MTELLIAAALDVISGDPPDRFHPVWWLGRLISWLEAVTYRFDGGFAGGMALAAGALAISLACVVVVLASSRLAGRKARLIAGALVIYSTISFRTLTRTALDIEALLDANRLHDARSRLLALVGRDLDDLTVEEATRATVESVAENTSDGVIAPLFYAALGGPVCAALYRTVNTLDSMVGYDNERYSSFGTASARIDDLLNLVPARLTAIAMLAAGAVLGRDPWRALGVMRRDAPGHRSPNAGWPEAAMAGLLGVRLGGVNRYRGREVPCAELGDALEPIEPAKISEAVRLSTVTCALALVTLAFVLARTHRRSR